MLYNNENGYSSLHVNALSNGDDRGKGETTDSIGSITDINVRIDSVTKNKYGSKKSYPDF